jgi:hypothetical protein
MIFHRKIALTAAFGLLIAAMGGAYQFFYLEERGEYEEAIRAQYRKSFGEEPDDAELRHLSSVAMDRYGPTEYYRTEEDYKKLFEHAAS